MAEGSKPFVTPNGEKGVRKESNRAPRSFTCKRFAAAPVERGTKARRHLIGGRRRIAASSYGRPPARPWQVVPVSLCYRRLAAAVQTLQRRCQPCRGENLRAASLARWSGLAKVDIARWRCPTTCATNPSFPQASLFAPAPTMSGRRSCGRVDTACRSSHGREVIHTPGTPRRPD